MKKREIIQDLNKIKIAIDNLIDLYIKRELPIDEFLKHKVLSMIQRTIW